MPIKSKFSIIFPWSTLSPAFALLAFCRSWLACDYWKEGTELAPVSQGQGSQDPLMSPHSSNLAVIYSGLCSCQKLELQTNVLGCMTAFKKGGDSGSRSRSSTEHTDNQAGQFWHIAMQCGIIVWGLPEVFIRNGDVSTEALWGCNSFQNRAMLLPEQISCSRLRQDKDTQSSWFFILLRRQDLPDHIQDTCLPTCLKRWEERESSGS